MAAISREEWNKYIDEILENVNHVMKNFIFILIKEMILQLYMNWFVLVVMRQQIYQILLDIILFLKEELTELTYQIFLMLHQLMIVKLNGNKGFYL